MADISNQEMTLQEATAIAKEIPAYIDWFNSDYVRVDGNLTARDLEALLIIARQRLDPPPADEPSYGDLTLTEARQIIESAHLEKYLSPIGFGDIPTYPDYLTDRQMRAIDLVNFANSITYQGY